MKLQHLLILFFALGLNGLQAQAQCTDDCVWPGDANNDGIANVFDLLPIGVNIGEQGYPRFDASSEWGPQQAIDWEQTSPDGINYKHFDSDGDGYITLADMGVVNANYTAINNGSVVQTTDVPQDMPAFALIFDTEEITFNSGSPEDLVVTAGLYVAEPFQPIYDLHGLAMQLQYPQDLALPHTISFAPATSSFFGEEAEIYMEEEEIAQYSRMEVAFTRTDGTGKTGNGRIADIEFIVIGDIIGGRAEQEVDYYVHINDLRLIDKKGNYIQADIVNPNPHFTIIKENTTDTNNPSTTNSLSIIPNPATDLIWIEGLPANAECSLYDMQGQYILHSSQNQIDVAALPRGVYLLQIKQEGGTEVHKVVLQ